MKKSACTLVVLAALALAACGDQNKDKGAAPAESKPAAEAPAVSADLAKLEKGIEEANKALGSMNNDMMKMSMTLDKSGEKPVVLHETTMLKMAADSPEAKAMTAMDTKAVEEQQLQAVCPNPAMKELLDAGVAYKVVMKDKDGKELTAINLDLAKCKK